MEEEVCKELGLKPGVKSKGVLSEQQKTTWHQCSIRRWGRRGVTQDWKNHNSGC